MAEISFGTVVLVALACILPGLARTWRLPK